MRLPPCRECAEPSHVCPCLHSGFDGVWPRRGAANCAGLYLVPSLVSEQLATMVLLTAFATHLFLPIRIRSAILYPGRTAAKKGDPFRSADDALYRAKHNGCKPGGNPRGRMARGVLKQARAARASP